MIKLGKSVSTEELLVENEKKIWQISSRDAINLNIIKDEYITVFAKKNISKRLYKGMEFKNFFISNVTDEGSINIRTITPNENDRGFEIFKK